MSTLPPAGSRSHSVIDSPVGPLTLVATRDALSGLYMEGQRHRPPEEKFGERVLRTRVAALGAAAEQLDAYFTGELTAFDVPFDLHGTPFQCRVWAGLRNIPYGETVSYGELAELIGQPGASRAVGLANGKNPVGVIIPCHRVLGSNGSLTGYGGGLDRKRFLLDLERRVSPCAATDRLF